MTTNVLEAIDEIKNKMQLLEKYEQKRKNHLEVCKKYQKERFATDEEYRKRLYEASREYQRRRYNEDPEFREAKLRKARERILKKRETLENEKINFQKIEPPKSDQ